MTNGRIYAASFENQAVTTAEDLFELVAPTDAAVELLEVHLSQGTEAGDAEEEMLRLSVITGYTTSGNGTSITPVPRSLGDSAFGGTAERNGGTLATAGTPVTHEAHFWNNRVPFDRIFLPETTIILSPSARLVVRLVTAPTDSTTMSGSILFKEIGG